MFIPIGVFENSKNLLAEPIEFELTSRIITNLETLSAGLTLTPEGRLILTTGSGIIEPETQWAFPKLAGTGNSFEARMTTVSGTLTTGTVGSWLALSVERSWTQTIGATPYVGTLEIRPNSGGVLLTATITFQSSTYAAPVGSTWNPSDKGSNITLSNGNKSATHAMAIWNSLRGVQSRSSGKYYFEITVVSGGTSGADVMVGVASAAASLSAFLGFNDVSSRQSIGWWGNSQLYTNINAYTTSVISGHSTGSVLGIGVDFTAKTIKFYSSGSVVSTYIETGSFSALFPAAALQNTGAVLLNTVTLANLPSGYTAWG